MKKNSKDKRIGRARKLLAGTLAAASMAGAFAVANTSTASAMPPDEFVYLCRLSGGDYAPYLFGVCVYPSGAVIVNNPLEP